MDITRVQIKPRLRYALTFNATTVTMDGKRIETTVSIGADALHHMMVKATKNKSKCSHDGAVDVSVIRVQEV